jgi:Domain of unknown function (DUF6532)
VDPLAGDFPHALKAGSRPIKALMDAHAERYRSRWLLWLQQRYVHAILLSEVLIPNPYPLNARVGQLYATIYEWRTGRQQVTEFSASTYLDVYLGHVHTLNHIGDKREGANHTMMGDIYSQARSVPKLLPQYSTDRPGTAVHPSPPERSSLWRLSISKPSKSESGA